ncbi:MAG TPA: hypothetical protein PKM88_08530 [bacterium]|nr:hypothetical protein [bacterium]
MLTVAVTGPALAGTSTLFRAIAGPAVAGDRAVVALPDPRLAALSALYSPKKTTPVQTCFFEAKAVPAALQEADALCVTIRCFSFTDDEKLDAGATLRGLVQDLLLEDQKRVENRLERLRKQKGNRSPAEEREWQLLEQLLPRLEQEQPVRGFELSADDAKLLRGYRFLTAKPLIIVGNHHERGIDAAQAAQRRGGAALRLAGDRPVRDDRGGSGGARQRGGEEGIPRLLRRRRSGARPAAAHAVRLSRGDLLFYRRTGRSARLVDPPRDEREVRGG